MASLDPGSPDLSGITFEAAEAADQAPYEYPSAAPGDPATLEAGRTINLKVAGRGNLAARRSLGLRLLWFVFEATVINNRLMPISAVRVTLLRLFGAKIGVDCRFLHAIKVKEPWNLTVGDRTWVGESVWIHNQGKITVGSDVCLSQGTFLTTGSHDAAINMNLRVDPIVIEDGVWISSFSVIQKGVTVGRSALVTPMSVVHKSLPAGGVYGGNPCKLIRLNRYRPALD